MKHIALLLLVTVALAFACSGDVPKSTGRAYGRGVYVPIDWQTDREVSGHRVHVLTKRIDCVRCHEFTNKDVGGVSPARCGECHPKEATLRHAAAFAEERFGPGVTSDCTSCHAFTLDGTGHTTDAGISAVPAPGDCARCHSKAQGKLPAVQVHGTSDCLTCHRPHEDQAPKPAPCETCHEAISTTHAAKNRTTTQVCTTCHVHQHAPASEALPTCASCHSEKEPYVRETALFADGHRECVGCHQPHSFERSQAVPCRSCHEDLHVLGAPRVRAHEQCTGCHSPHDVKESAGKACPSCHQNIHPDHPKHGVAGTCVGCHDPHPPASRVKARARDCSTCHQIASSDQSFHSRVTCRTCHVPHEFVRKLSNHDPCRLCHERQVTLTSTLPGHEACEGCHRGLPHRPEHLQAACASCHATIKKAALVGHQACLNCHEPHGGQSRVDCGSCHAEEHQTAPAGHQNCLGCHQQHTGSTQKVACSTCHADAAKTPHGAQVKQCTSCHRPHGPTGVEKPPACTTCHSSSKLPGLHRTAQHALCTQCHSGHGEVAQPLRKACTSCHQDRKNHFPETNDCASCHLFVQTR